MTYLVGAPHPVGGFGGSSGGGGGGDGHTHANKAVLDGISAPNLAPNGGLVGQVLTVGASGREWQDVPGILYPSLILSPGYCMDRNGPMTPTIQSGVTVVAGQYGDAWNTASGRAITAPQSYINPNAYTILIRATYTANDEGSSQYTYIVDINSTNGVMFGRRDNSPYIRLGFHGGVSQSSETPAFPVGVPSVTGARYNGSVADLLANGTVVRSAVAGPAVFGSKNIRLGGSSALPVNIESLLIYPAGIPTSEIARISNMATAWNMGNTGVNMLVSPGFMATNKTAPGTTNMRTAPGAATTLIVALAANTLIQDTGGRVTESSVSYAQVTAVVGGGNVTGWIPVSQITTL